MAKRDNEEQMLRSVALRNARSILHARQRAERELVRANEALKLQTEELELLNRTGASLASTLDLQALLQTVTDAATQVSGAKFGAFFYNTVAEDGESYQLYTLSGAPRQAFEGFDMPRSTPLFAPTFKGEGTVRIDDVLADPRYGQMAPHHGMPTGHLPVRSYLAVPVVSRDGSVIGGLFFGHPEIGVFTDRTESVVASLAAQSAMAIDNARLFASERAARAEAERVSRMKDEFLATLSHELRTPLNAILGWSQVLLLRKDIDPDIKAGIETIVRNARAQTQLIEDLLDMSRIISGKVRLDVQPLDIVGVVDAALESVRLSAETKEIRLRKILDPSAGPVSGDPNRLQQVVWNLLSNAIKFTPKQGAVDVLLQRVNSHIELMVRDSGIGIRPEFLPHVFDRFRQADASSTRTYTGLGLGLSIVKHLVELHGGGVRATSDGEGTGATFVVSLPLAPVRVDGARRHPSADKTFGLGLEQLSLNGINVLVIDDDADARELIRHVLSECNANVVTAPSADAAIQLLETQRPDVVVSDIGMPGKDGYEFMRELRRRPAVNGGDTPAVALTAFARSEDRTRALMAGYQMHVSKPIEPQELIVTVASLAGRRDKDH